CHAQRPGLAHGGGIFAAAQAFCGFLIEQLCLRRALANRRQRSDHYSALVEAGANYQLLTNFWLLAGLAALALAMHLAALDSRLGQRAGLEEARRPQPLVQPYFVVVFFAHYSTLPHRLLS